MRSAYRAFATRDSELLRSFCHSSLELRPIDALGLVGDTVSGFEAAREWAHNHDARRVTIWLRTLEQVTDDSVLGVGVVAERGRGCAATVAWIWRVRDGLIDSVSGYPSEAAAWRAINGHS